MKRPDPPPLLAGTRQKGETAKAMGGCNDYLMMSSGRSIRKLLELYRGDPKQYPGEPPTKALPTLKGWSRKFGWVKRSEEYDAKKAAEKDAMLLEGMRQGLALDRVRVDALKWITDLLIKQLGDDGSGLYWTDKKQIGRGKTAKVVEVKRYNSALVTNFLSALNDLAKETGGRPRLLEATGKDQEPLVPTQAIAALVREMMGKKGTIKKEDLDDGNQ